jgi:hypothetical protein
MSAAQKHKPSLPDMHDGCQPAWQVLALPLCLLVAAFVPLAPSAHSWLRSAALHEIPTATHTQLRLTRLQPRTQKVGNTTHSRPCTAPERAVTCRADKQVQKAKWKARRQARAPQHAHPRHKASHTSNKNSMGSTQNRRTQYIRGFEHAA